MSFKKRLGKVTENQKKILVEYVKTNSNLISGRFSPQFTKKDCDKLWEEISITLNIMTGANKPWQGWRKCWQDIRSRTKSKIGSLKNLSNQTGGGPPPNVDLSTTEEDIYTIIKQVSVEGHSTAQESITNFDFDDYNGSSDDVLIEPVSTVEDHTYYVPIVEDDEVVRTEPQEHSCEKVETPNKKQLSKKMANVINATAAATAFKTNLDKKIIMKEDYYQKKLEIMERNAVTNEKMLLLEEKKINIWTAISNSLNIIANKNPEYTIK